MKMIYVGSKERMQTHVLKTLWDFFGNTIRYPCLDRGEINKEAAGRHERRCLGGDSDGFLYRHGEDRNVRGGCVQDCSWFNLHLLGCCPSLVDLPPGHLD